MAVQPTTSQDLSIGCSQNSTFLQFVFTRKSLMNAFPTTSHSHRSSMPWTSGGVGAIQVFVGHFLHLRELWSLLVSYFCAWFIGWCFCCSSACTTFITKIWHFNVERPQSWFYSVFSHGFLSDVAQQKRSLQQSVHQNISVYTNKIDSLMDQSCTSPS